jgi:hypothetical protein
MAQAAQAIAQAQQMASQGQGQAASPSPGQPQNPGQSQTPGQTPGQGTAQQPQPGQTSAMASAGGVSTGGDWSENQEAPDAPLQLQPATQGDSRTADSDEDSDAKQLRFKDEPWFAKLPPSLRNAIRARARRPAPRGYEERLRRYFESID